MEKMMIYTVQDKKAEAFTTPFFNRNDAVAIRNLTTAVNQEGHAFSEHAEDYDLWVIGEFSIELGQVIAGPEKLIARAIDLVRKD